MRLFSSGHIDFLRSRLVEAAVFLQLGACRFGASYDVLSVAVLDINERRVGVDQRRVNFGMAE